jgi:hypothetical protein
MVCRNICESISMIIAGQLHYSMAKNTAEDANVALSLNRMVALQHNVGGNLR